ncbi:MAG: hypothetical protein U5K30_13955 [Acidimicrobiales bacterium]|nr:hypothetical protein [Acidimicrobiales bacterium]
MSAKDDVLAADTQPEQFILGTPGEGTGDLDMPVQTVFLQPDGQPCPFKI